MKYYFLEKNRENTKVIHRSEKLKPYFYFAEGQNSILFSESTQEHILTHSDQYPGSLVTLVRSAKEDSVSESEEQNLKRKVHYTMSSYLQDPPAPKTFQEIELVLHANPKFSLEYLGRGLENHSGPFQGEIKEDSQSFVLDIAGGHRQYVWAPREQGTIMAEADRSRHFANLKHWFEDPDANIVLSLGSGGMRMFGILAVLKILDMIDVRKNIDEIWGCSGGSIMGYLYSMGVQPHSVEKIGYDFYSNRYPEFSFKRSNLSTFKNVITAHLERYKNIHKLGEGLVEIQKVMEDIMTKAVETKKKDFQRIPFYCLSTNLTKKRFFPLGLDSDISEACRDYIIASDPRRAVIASSAIPFIFPYERIKTDSSNPDLWVDGGLGEEVPLLYPLVKWRKELHAGLPERKKKLKIFYVDLNMRFNELKFLLNRNFTNPALSTASYFGKIVDLMLDSRMENATNLLNTLPDVEVIGVKLIIKKSAVLSVKEIPYIIQEGRKCFLSQLTELNRALNETKSIKKAS